MLVAHRPAAALRGAVGAADDVVGDDEAAEDALRRHARSSSASVWARRRSSRRCTCVDPDDQSQYVANIFRTPIAGGPMRFNAAGRLRRRALARAPATWISSGCRRTFARPLVQILTDRRTTLHETDWSTMHGEALPLAEQAATPPAGPAPDNRAGWDAISAALSRRSATAIAIGER